MSLSRKKAKDIRRAFGQGAVQEIAETIKRVNELVEFAQRPFWGRLRWLLFGR